MSILLYEKRDQIAYITMNRPDAMNAFNNELIEALGDALVDYRDDPSLLVGTHNVFSKCIHSYSYGKILLVTGVVYSSPFTIISNRF